MLLSLLPRASWLSSECLLCRDAVAGAKPLCRACEKQLPFNECCCHSCALPLMIPASHCAQCLQHPLHVKQAFSVFRYDEQIGHLLNRFKHRQDLACGQLLAKLALKPIKQAIKREQLQRPDFLLTVPLHRRRQQQRGFNQAHEVAKLWGSALTIPLLGGLTRRKATAALQQLDCAGRARAVRDAFHLTRMPPSAHIALVDDVLTTGATSNEIASLLYGFGARQVDLWTLARVP